MNLESLTSQLRSAAENSDEQLWPADGIRILRESGCFKHIVPCQYGGDGADPAAQLAVYEAVAAGNVSLALILTQHDAAAEVLAAADSESIGGEILTGCAGGQELLTVGISQVTTSRRHGQSAMRAARDGEGFALDGIMPWVTSAPKADHIVTAAAFENGEQILACVPTNASGISVGEPMQLLALQSSWTSEVRCQDLHIPRSWVLRGPMKSVLARRAPVKGLTVSAVGIGMAGRLLHEVRQLAEKLSGTELLIQDTIEPQYHSVRQQLMGVASSLHDPASESPAIEIRANVNAIVHRLAATLMTLAKGTGFLATRPTQRLVRESAFFLVWSAAPPVQLETLGQIWHTHG